MEETRKQSKHLKNLLNPIWKENPLFVLVLGTCPSLAITTSVESCIGMGLLFTFVLVFSNLLVSLLRNIIAEEIRTPCYIVIIATFVTVTKMLTEAFLPELYSSLGVFLSLLVVNCIVLGRAEAFASKNGPWDSVLDGIGNGIGFTLALLILGIIREVLGTGVITFGQIFSFLPKVVIPVLKWRSVDLSISIFSTPAGGFIALALVLAFIQAIHNHKEAKAKALKRAEVTRKEGEK